MLLTDRILVTITCCQCGVPFGMPEYVVVTKRQDEQNFYCPLGHQQHFSRSYVSELDALRSRVKDLAASRDHEHQQRLAAQAERDRVKRSAALARRRHAAGVCPCCHRTFVAMARHIKTKHPEYQS